MEHDGNLYRWSLLVEPSPSIWCFKKRREILLWSTTHDLLRGWMARSTLWPKLGTPCLRPNSSHRFHRFQMALGHKYIPENCSKKLVWYKEAWTKPAVCSGYPAPPSQFRLHLLALLTAYQWILAWPRPQSRGSYSASASLSFDPSPPFSPVHQFEAADLVWRPSEWIDIRLQVGCNIQSLTKHFKVL